MLLSPRAICPNKKEYFSNRVRTYYEKIFVTFVSREKIQKYSNGDFSGGIIYVDHEFRHEKRLTLDFKTLDRFENITPCLHQSCMRAGIS